MPEVYTPLPKRYGECQLAKQLLQLNDSQLHLWFGLDFIPQVSDIDILVYHEQFGIFVIEVKAVSLDSVLTFGYKECRIEGRDEKKPPQIQAYEAFEALQKYLYPRMKTKKPMIISTVCWPRISRYEWNNCWDNESVIGEYSKRMIFQEDVMTGARAFMNRLKFIWSNPPVRGGAKWPFTHSPKQLDDFKRAFDVKAKPRTAVSDFQKLKRIEDDVSKSVLDEVPATNSLKIVYYGYPGTGKTFRLLQIGVSHALNGRNVLYTCYNKVLGSDIQRILSSSSKLPLCKGPIKVHDIYEILACQSVYHGIKCNQKEEYDLWAEAVIDAMRDDTVYREQYDTILVDESQDLPSWAFTFLEMHATDATSWCVATGSGQELYGEQSDWIQRFITENRTRELRRNFRNTMPTIQVAYLFHNSELDCQQIENMMRTKFLSKKRDIRMEFDRKDGRTPYIHLIDESHLDQFSNNEFFYAKAQLDVMVNEYKRIIEEQLSSLRANVDMPIDLLILVPNSDGSEHLWVTSALKQMGQDYIDYTKDENRRHIAQSDMIRVCTFHSSRGVEGVRVIVFGFERIEMIAQSMSISICNLGYIVLSRSVFETVVAIRPGVDSLTRRVLEECIRTVDDALIEVIPNQLTLGG